VGPEGGGAGDETHAADVTETPGDIASCYRRCWEPVVDPREQGPSSLDLDESAGGIGKIVHAVFQDWISV
jgi:hypothetical protein